MLRGMAGYKKDAPMVNNLWVLIQSMSDSDLREYLAKVDRALAETRALPEGVVDVEAEKSLDKT